MSQSGRCGNTPTCWSAPFKIVHLLKSVFKVFQTKTNRLLKSSVYNLHAEFIIVRDHYGPRWLHDYSGLSSVLFFLLFSFSLFVLDYRCQPCVAALRMLGLWRRTTPVTLSLEQRARVRLTYGDRNNNNVAVDVKWTAGMKMGSWQDLPCVMLITSANGCRKFSLVS